MLAKMKIHLALLLAALGLTSQLASAQEKESAATESRDAASAFVGAMQFTVGRIGRDCLASSKRTETPQEFVDTWLRRNGKYAAATSAYLQVRIAEAESKGEVAKNSLMRELASVRSNAERDINSLYEKNGQEAACERMVTIIDSGAYDITSRVPVFSEIEALHAWAQKQ